MFNTFLSMIPLTCGGVEGAVVAGRGRVADMLNVACDT
jgi:hypothetical protein